jgi:hypothetical protein
VVEVGFEPITGGDDCEYVTAAGVVVDGALGDDDGGGIVEEINEEDGGDAVDEIFGVADSLSEGGGATVPVFSFALESRDF